MAASPEDEGTEAVTENGDEEDFELDDDVGEGPSGPPPLVYDGFATTIAGLPTRAELVRGTPQGVALTAKLETLISEGRSVLFMPTDVNESNEYSRGLPLFKIHLIGCLPNGAKAHVILDEVEVFFDVRVPASVTKGDFGNQLRQVLFERDAGVERIEDVEARPLHGHRQEAVPWKRLFFPNLQARKKAIEFVRNDLEHETASDDLTSYFRMAARVNGVVLTDWAVLANYEYYRGGAHPDGPSGARGAPVSPLCEHVFRVKPRGCQPLVDPMAPKEVREKRQEMKQKSPSLSQDKTLVLAWDIETRTLKKTGELPRATNPEDSVFMICATAHWKDDPDALCKVCLVDVPTEPDARWTTIVCGSEQNVVRAFAVVYRHFAPDIVAGFNDGDYDWPYIIETARQNFDLAFLVDTMDALPRGRGATEEGVLKWNVTRDKKIKLGADEVAYVTYLKVPGSVPVDLRVMYRQLFPKADVGKGTSSLNFYLKVSNLPLKADMPHTRMWAIRAREDAAQLRHVAHYCVIDAKRCQELLVKRNVVNDRRAVAALSFVSLFDAFYYANGHKVCNLSIAYAIRRGILCSNINHADEDHGKYPGAWVFHPDKGLVPDPTDAGTVALEAARAEYLRLKALAETDTAVAARLVEAEKLVLAALKNYHPGRPVTSLDYSSLYPSIIMTYNLSPEKFVADEEEANRLKAAGHDLYFTEFLFNRRQVRGWFVRHNNVEAEIGLFPAILIDLFNKRAEIKKQLALFEELKERMELIMGLAEKDAARPFGEIFAGNFAGLRTRLLDLGEKAAVGQEDARRLGAEVASITRILAALEPLEALAPAALRKNFEARYREVCFDHTAVDARQKALKVFMNTFYGETGHSISPFFLLQLAGGVTTAGQYNIKMIAEFVAQKGFRIRYGDTDSLYIACPEGFFREVDERYALGRLEKEEYWTEMVRITMAELDVLRDEVNAHLQTDNGSRYLKMAYEEVLYPVTFTGKKKYFGIAHVNVPNFRPKKLFIRGIDVVKQGQTELTKKIGHRIMWAAVSLTNDRSLLRITEDVLRDAVVNGGQWSFDDFVQSSAWKPNKDNKSVQRFVARMRIRVAEESAENERRLARGLPPLKTLYYIPDPGERFQYVLVKPGAAFDLRGLKATPKKGDIMEYAEVARARGLPIDVAQYLSSYVVGLCARFVNYAARFQPQQGGLDKKVLDKKSQDAAKKYLSDLVFGLQNADPATMRKRGYAYKRAWRCAAKDCGEKVFEAIGPAAEVLHGNWLDWSDFLPSEEQGTVAVLAAQAQRLADGLANLEKQAVTVARALKIDTDGSDLGSEAGPNGRRPAVRLYAAAAALGGGRRRKEPTLRSLILSALDRHEAGLRLRLGELAPAAAAVATRYEAGLARAVGRYRRQEHAERPELGEFAAENPEGGEWVSPFEPDDGRQLAEIRRLWYELAGIYVARAHHRALVAHLDLLKNRRQRLTPPPAPADVRRAIADGARRLPPLGLAPLGDGGY